MSRYLDAVAACFRQHPNTDVSNWTLMEIGGSQAWRTRVSECRTKLGMHIPKPRMVRSESGAVTTLYRFVPEAKTYTNLLQIAEDQ